MNYKHIDDIEQYNQAFAIIGFACDEGVRRNKGRLGARLAPPAIRSLLAKLPYHLPKDVETIDIGDVSCESGDLEKAQEELGQVVSMLYEKNKTPIILGGGHETLYGHYLGAKQFIGHDKTLGIINIDAHFDMRDDEVPSSGTMFRQILEQDDKASYLCLGIQEFGNTKSLFQTAEKLGCHYILEKDLTKDDFQHTFKTIDEFLNNNDHVIVTLCTDSIQSSAAPGVSAPSPFGIEPNTARTILNYIVSKENVLSFDISEVNPLLDEDEKTVRLAAYLVAEIMSSF